jgi:hypothetical protein
MTRHLVWLVSAGLLSCTGPDEGLHPQSNEATAEEALALQQVAQDDLAIEAALLDDMSRVLPEDSRFLLPRPLGSLFAIWEAPVDPACVITSRSIDADDDGVPLYATIAFDCKTHPDRGTLVTVNGRAVIEDTNDDVADSGFHVQFVNLTIVHDPLGPARQSREFDGSVDLVVRGRIPKLSYGFDFQQNLDIRYEVSRGTTVQKSVYRTATTGDYMPERGYLTSDPLAKGRLTFDGEAILASPSGRVTMWRWTDPILHWNRLCRPVTSGAPHFDRGAVVERDSFGNMLRVEFVGCGLSQTTYTGKTEL